MTGRHLVTAISLVVLASAAAHAGQPPVSVASAPTISDLGLVGVSVALAGFAARFLAKRARRS